MRDRKRVYLEIWSCIEEIYFDGYLVYESGLQAALYAELCNTLPGVNILAEPVWEVGDQKKKIKMRPDLVIVEKGQITDIFELKFMPHYSLTANDVWWDIQKLLQYGVNEEGYPVRLNPNTGRLEENLPVWNACRLHFVAVANYDAAAVLPQNLMAGVPELQNNPGRLNHWFGRVGGDTDQNREWSIKFSI